MVRIHGIAGLIAAVLMGTAITSVWAANPQGASGEGKAWAAGLNKYRGQSAGRRIRHAREYVGGVQHYTKRTPQIVPMIAPEHVEEVGRNIDAAKKDLAEIKKGNADDKSIVARVESIEKQLDAASAQQKMMHEECCKESPDGEKTMECCAACMKHLDAAAKEHGELMKVLDPKGETKEEHDHGDHKHNEAHPKK